MNDVRMGLTLQDMKKHIPERFGTTEMAHSSPEVPKEFCGPMLKTVKNKKAQNNGAARNE